LNVGAKDALRSLPKLLQNCFMPRTKFISTVHLGTEYLFLPMAIEEATIPIITERVSGEMEKRPDLGQSQGTIH